MKGRRLTLGKQKPKHWKQKPKFASQIRIIKSGVCEEPPPKCTLDPFAIMMPVGSSITNVSSEGIEFAGTS